MKLFAVLALANVAAAASTQGIRELVQRRLPNHADWFSFELRDGNNTSRNTLVEAQNDEFTVSSRDGKILVEGTTLSALATGLHRYLTDVSHVDISWFTGSRLHLAPSPLPTLNQTIRGASTVPWRYHFNTVTFSYTTAFWSWEDWELQLDWMALRGVNLPLAWVGIEKVLQEVYLDIGLSRDEIFDFFSGPAFQSWNRFENIQDSWGRDLPQSWVDGQFELQKKIVQRMVDLGMTPVLPAFTGFVPRAFPRAFPGAKVVNGSRWNGFSLQYTNDTFLEPEDPLFTKLQKQVISKQLGYFGNVTNIFTLDQYNENDPASGELKALLNTTLNTWKSLKTANPEAIWMLQGWLFFSNSEFWTNERVEAYLSGVENNSDMLILDLFSETQPQWQRFNSYYGKPWIFCELHNYGGNMGFYGQVENVTVNAVNALSESSSMVGMGLTMEGQEGNEIVYDLLLDQAWSQHPIDTTEYFSRFAVSRYGPSVFPNSVEQAWDILLHTAYNNTNLTTQAVTKSILELRPNSTGLLNRLGHHPTTITYDRTELVKAWKLFLNATHENPSLWGNEPFTFDLADLTRQILANTFPDLYSSFLSSVTPEPTSTSSEAGNRMLSLLRDLDLVLSASHPSFHLSTWEDAARAWAPTSGNSTQAASDLLAYNARNQVTLWGPQGEISDYASKSWSGLAGEFYKERWRIWIEEYERLGAAGVDQKNLRERLLSWEKDWVTRGLTGLDDEVQRRNTGSNLKDAIKYVGIEWKDELGL